MSESPLLPAKLIDIHNHINGEDAGGDRLLELMDSLDIETTLVMSTAGSDHANIRLAVEKHPGRFVAGVYTDPRQGAKALETVRAAYGEGTRVMKLFPNFGYYPDDDEFRPLFDLVAELGMGVLSHCGWLTPSAGVTAAYYSHPGRFEKLVRTYTDTIFIFAHMGGIAGFLETIMLTTRTPNAYVDCTPGQGLWVLEYAGQMASAVPPDRLMWGADGYGQQALLPRYVQALVKMGLAEHFEKIFYSNAKGLLQRIGALPS